MLAIRGLLQAAVNRLEEILACYFLSLPSSLA